MQTFEDGMDIFRGMDLSFSHRRHALQDISSTSMMRGSHSESNMALIPSAFLTPSPEEQIIRQRSLRSKPMQEKDECLTDFYRNTPSKDGGFSQLARKRLLLSPEASPVKSPEKRMRRQRGSSDVPLATELGGYSTKQLVDVIDRLVDLHPFLEEEVRATLPPPDLKPLEIQLASLRKNVYRAFPNARWSSSRDSYSYKRVRVHLQTFKKTCLDQCQVLCSSQCWEAVALYAAMSWRYIHKLPDWDEPAHNTLKSRCFEAVAVYCMQALKRGKLEKEQLWKIQKKLEAANQLNGRLTPCLAYITDELNKLQ